MNIIFVQQYILQCKMLCTVWLYSNKHIIENSNINIMCTHSPTHLLFKFKMVDSNYILKLCSCVFMIFIII